MSTVTIRDVQVIATQPAGARLVIVKILTSEPGLHGVGCATFTQRFRAVIAAVERHLKPLLIGRDVDRIEEIYQLSCVNGYWRNGPVLNNAISGVDQALWDIKGKRAGMPVYQLLGGKCREAAACYAHAGGTSKEEIVDSIRAYQEQGYQYIRVQQGGYGGLEAERPAPEGAQPGSYFDPRGYMRAHLEVFDHVREQLGFGVELLHDVHERLVPIDAVGFAKEMERFRLYFLEDPLAPEDLEWFRNIRQQCSTPIAMGELFNHPREWQPLIQDRLIDFLRMHVSQMGGLTPARNVAAFADMYGIRTAWHGPGDVSRGPRRQPAPGPVGAQLRGPGVVPVRRPGGRDLPRHARGAGRLHVSQRQPRTRHRRGRGAGGAVSLHGRGRDVDADAAPGRQSGAAVRRP